MQLLRKLKHFRMRSHVLLTGVGCFCAFLLVLECYGAATPAKHGKGATTTKKPGAVGQNKNGLGKDAGVGYGSDQEVEKFMACRDKCKGSGDQMECGVNGWWFPNKCQRECQGVKQSTNKDQECDPYVKSQHDGFKKCQAKCGNSTGKREDEVCAEDGEWYVSKCWMECNGLKSVDEKICKNLDKIYNCQEKCVKDGFKPVCGADGQYYDNACTLKCTGIKQGVEGKECAQRMNLEKYWKCQEKCNSQVKQEVCGLSGFYFYNKCHIDCYGDKPGTPGKDCEDF